jgi:DMSO/TMAO reductase YedYZ molybdopterin-dependent catalytic subunit
VTPRGTDCSLAVVASLLVATGAAILFAGERGDAWVVGAHGTAGFTLAAILLAWKLPRVRERLFERRRWDDRTVYGALALALVVATLASGFAWAGFGPLHAAGYSVLLFHGVLGALVIVAVAAHASLRARPAPAGQLTSRRQFLASALVTGGALAAWELQRPFERLVGLRGARRRFTGSYEVASFEGNAFPTTSWVSDRPRPLAPGDDRLDVGGRVRRPLSLALAELTPRDELVATLDCTGGFYSTQRWRGVRLARLIDRAEPLADARYVRVVSRTGYRWGFALDDAGDLLLATHVGGEPLSHEHGAPLRLVAPGRRGFEWVKWVVRVELHDRPDYLGAASTVWSSFTRTGRGAD